MRTSEAIGELAIALAKAQAEMKTVTYDKQVNTGKYSYRYASLSKVMAAVLPALTKNELAVTQGITQESGTVMITTRLLHSSGQWLEGDCVMPVGSGGPQAVGSAITYGRRYGLSTLLGVATDEDDDGATAEASAKTMPTEDTKPRRPRGSGTSRATRAMAKVRGSEESLLEHIQAIGEAKGDDWKKALVAYVDKHSATKWLDMDNETRFSWVRKFEALEEEGVS